MLALSVLPVRDQLLGQWESVGVAHVHSSAAQSGLFELLKKT